MLAGIFLFFFSCVPTRQFQELKNKNEICKTERDSLKGVNEELTVRNTEMESTIEELQKKISGLQKNKANLLDSIKDLQAHYSSTNKLYEELKIKHNQILSSNDRQDSLLLADLQQTKEDLQLKEDQLKMLEITLDEKKNNLEILQNELEQRNQVLTKKDSLLEERKRKFEEIQAELAERNKKLSELQAILDSKDSVVNALKNKVSSALLGFQNEGLSVNIKNGKVYVSLDEKLLFKFGSAEVDPKGVKALKKLAGVLEQNPDVNILIEGHTDDIGDKNYNWDLSVKRATAVVKIITQNSDINPSRLTAAGKGQYSPVDPEKTDEARRKNRRTEIILTPKLDELFRILETN